MSAFKAPSFLGKLSFDKTVNPLALGWYKRIGMIIYLKTLPFLEFV